MKTEIINCMTNYANRVAETVQYKNWSDKFCREEVSEATMDFVSGIRKHIDFYNLSEDEAIFLGFRKWSKLGNLYLIPLYLLPIIPVGIKLTCISGEEIIYNGTNIDDDVRFGLLAYGINITE